MTQLHKATAWAVLALLASLLTWLGFRGYFNPELLIHFTNHLTC